MNNRLKKYESEKKKYAKQKVLLYYSETKREETKIIDNNKKLIKEEQKREEEIKCTRYIKKVFDKIKYLNNPLNEYETKINVTIKVENDLS